MEKNKQELHGGKLRKLPLVTSGGCEEEPSCLMPEGPQPQVTRGHILLLRYPQALTTGQKVRWSVKRLPSGPTEVLGESDTQDFYFHTATVPEGALGVSAELFDPGNNDPSKKITHPDPLLLSAPANVMSPQGTVVVRQAATQLRRTNMTSFFSAVRYRSETIGFGSYGDFIEKVLCDDGSEVKRSDFAQVRKELQEERSLGLNSRFMLSNVGAHDLLRLATELFLLQNCGVKLPDSTAGDPADAKQFFEQDTQKRQADVTSDMLADDLRARLSSYMGNQDGRLPYLKRVLDRAVAYGTGNIGSKAQQSNPFCSKVVVNAELTDPCLLELIWSYWMEEGMLVQSMNAIGLRFQNRRSSNGQDPLQALNMAPLQPLSHLFWGYIQDEHNRLTVRHRAYEYDHTYGLRLEGRAVPQLESADSRSKFLEAFHRLLYLCTIFYRQRDDTNIIADAFPVLNALREVHLLLAEGMHNQYGNLTWTARREMMMQQWILARGEFTQFLGHPVMVPYEEPWMGRVDVLKKMKGWTDVSVTHFRNLAIWGERLLLSIRFGDWADNMKVTRDEAGDWADYWRDEIQGYIHAYRAVTGIDLGGSAKVDSVLPSIHLRRRLESQRPALANPLTNPLTQTKAVAQGEVYDESF